MLAEICNKLINENTVGAVKFEADNNTYWLKSAGEDKDNFIRRVSVFLAKYDALSFFDIKAAWSSIERMQHEKKVLHYLNEKKFAAPQIEHDGNGFFVTIDNGVPLNSVDQERINQSTIDDIFTLILDLHSHNIAHGRPALRDIVIDDNNALKLLDYEEAIIDPTDQKMARDIFILLLELNDLTSITEDQKINSLLVWKEKTSNEVWLQLIKLSKLVQGVVFLAHLVQFFKKRNRLSRQIIKTVKLMKKVS
jgi:tRNA A-37 threonylcarbamoyl transferase component Bud32